jgi:hypothetical protein
MSLSQMMGEEGKDPKKTTENKTLDLFLGVMIDTEGPLS